MIGLCREYYQNNKNELKKVTNMIKLTDEGFLYKLLNKKLGTEDIQLLYIFRFFIIDLCAAIDNITEMCHVLFRLTNIRINSSFEKQYKPFIQSFYHFSLYIL